LPRIVAGPKLANGTFTNNDAVVAEDFDFVQRSPKAGGGALPCSGVADEQVGCAVGAGDADAVELDGALLGEAMHDQEFVERIGKRRYVISKLREEVRIELECRTLKGTIHEEPLGRGLISERVAKVKAKLLTAIAQAPSGPRVEKGRLVAGRNGWKPLHLNVYVGTTCVNGEGFVLRIDN
jgi:hypothetical protein